MSQIPPQKPVPPHMQAQYSPPPPQPTNGMGIAGFVLSLMGLLGFGCVITSLVGTIVSYYGCKQEPKGMAQAGFVLGIIGSIIWLAAVVIYLLIIFVFVGTVGFFGWTAYDVIEDYRPLAEANMVILEEWDGQGDFPTEEEGNELIKGRKDRHGNQIKYETNERSFTIRGAGDDGVFNTPDDITIGPFRSYREAENFDVEEAVEQEAVQQDLNSRPDSRFDDSKFDY